MDQFDPLAPALELLPTRTPDADSRHIILDVDHVVDRLVLQRSRQVSALGNSPVNENKHGK